MQVAALEAEATAAAAAASVAKRAAAASEERLGEVVRERAAACRTQQVCHSKARVPCTRVAGIAAAAAQERLGRLAQVSRPQTPHTGHDFGRRISCSQSPSF